MGPWRDPPSQVEPDTATPDPPAARSLEASSRAAPSTPPPEPHKHKWRWQQGRWLCVNCLATSRTAVPSRIFNCPGLAANMRALLQNPRGHTLQVAFTGGAGMVVICSQC